MNTMPDVVPTLSVVALFARGATAIRNVAHLRYKESDRLQALATELAKLGATVTPRPDGLDIVPTPLHGAQLATYGDHRLVMSFALAGLRVPGVRIEEPDSVRKSYPRFWAEFEKLSPSPTS
jgi:3-phosphoshikimate 1-carboxyvinyltransferase